MVIKTRYNIGEIVWFMRGNKVLSAPIGRIEYSTNGKFYSLSYQLKGYMECLHPDNFQEHQLFQTKKELIDSL
jgi:hypothetical protein|nr:MAG TPA: hypothetical protein [Crassvirales sp.]